jgi:hypothetical protein
MADLMIVAQDVLLAASDLEKCAQSISECLTSTSRIVDELSESWKSNAGALAITNYRRFANANFPGFSCSVKGYGSFLRKEVGEGYSETEASNEDLARMYL